MHNQVIFIGLVVIACSSCMLAAISIGYLLGYNYRRTQDWLAKMNTDFTDHIQKTESDEYHEPSIVDVSPAVVKKRKEQRERYGKPEQDPESQIVVSKSLAQLQEEEMSAKEAKLDKWMPGARSGK